MAAPAGHMTLTVTTEADDVALVAIAPTATLSELASLVEAHTGVPVAAQRLLHDGKPLAQGAGRLDAAGVRDGDLLMCLRASPAAPRAAGAGGAQAAAAATARGADGAALNPEAFQARAQKLHDRTLRPFGRCGCVACAFRRASGANPLSCDVHSCITPAADASLRVAQALVRANPQMVPDPELRSALLSSVAEMQRILRADHTQRTEAERRRHELANADPFDLDAQRKIEEEITKENVAANLEQAMEQAPEMVVGSVFMLYVNWCVPLVMQLPWFVASAY